MQIHLKYSPGNVEQYQDLAAATVAVSVIRSLITPGTSGFLGGASEESKRIERGILHRRVRRSHRPLVQEAYTVLKAKRESLELAGKSVAGKSNKLEETLLEATSLRVVAIGHPFHLEPLAKEPWALPEPYHSLLYAGQIRVGSRASPTSSKNRPFEEVRVASQDKVLHQLDKALTPIGYFLDEAATDLDESSFEAGSRIIEFSPRLATKVADLGEQVRRGVDYFKQEADLLLGFVRRYG